MFAVLIPTFYAGSIHGLWIGLGVFCIMTVLILWCNIRGLIKLLQADDEEIARLEAKSTDPFELLENRRFWIALIAFILIGLSGMERCFLDKENKEHCRSFWSQP
jgi:Na+/melibiose symporter-like transporter